VFGVESEMRRFKRSDVSIVIGASAFTSTAAAAAAHHHARQHRRNGRRY